jgi:hypothetical protein
MAVERGKVLVQITQVKKLSDSTEQVIGRNVTVEVEGIEQLLLSTTLSSHHSRVSLSNILASSIAKNQPISRELFKCKGLPRPEATLESHGIECHD